MSSIQPCPERRLRERGGFTLVELLVALTISSLLVTVILQLLQGNSNFVRLQSAREEVQQNGRAALDLIANDLRAAPPGGFLRMDSAAVRFRVPRAWGVLCNPLDSGSATAWVLFPSGVLPTDPFWERSHWGIGVEQTPDPLNHTGVYGFVGGTTQQTTGDPCAAIQPNLTAAHVRLGFNKPSGTAFVTSGSVRPGTQVLLYEEMQYDVAASSTAGAPGTWVRRMAGHSTGSEPNMQPIAGPVPASGALRFTYLRADGVTAATGSADLRQIQVRLITQSRAERTEGGVRVPQQVDTLATSVFLHNHPE